MTTKLERILYVEDEPDIRVIAELALVRVGGFQLKVCDSGQAAIDAAPAFRPQLMLLDVMMPGMDGLETFAALRQRPETAEVPAIFMTAKAQRHETDHYLQLGAIGVIAKPFDPLELPATLASIWAEAATNGMRHAS